MKNKVSIVMPSYNHEKYIAEAIESVLRQTYENWELIIIDDGSADRSLEIIGRYVEKHPARIRLYTHSNRENKGLKSTILLGVEKTMGDYIAFLESDDILADDSIKERINILVKYPEIGLVYSDVKLIGPPSDWLKSNKRWIRGWRKRSRLCMRDSLFHRRLLNGNFICTFSCVALRKELLKQSDFDIPENYMRWLDLWLWTTLSLRTIFRYIPKQLTLWRMHEKSQNAQVNLQARQKTVNKYSKFLELLKDRFSRINKVAIVIPVYKSYFTDEEKLSLRHLERYLGAYNKFVVAPQGVKTSEIKGAFIHRFKQGYFRNKQTYNNLLRQKHFYERFSAYEFILIYQLDCLVFRDELIKWCRKGYDYIGAPWYHDVLGDKMYWANYDCVGNGGFSLRRVKSFVRLFEAYNSLQRRIFNWIEVFAQKVSRGRKNALKENLSKIVGKVASFPSKNIKEISDSLFEHEIRYFTQEDIFICTKSRKYLPEFKIAPVEEAVAFSFDAGPQYCFERNKRQLPFGCHAWFMNNKPYYEGNRGFWESYVLKEDE